MTVLKAAAGWALIALVYVILLPFALLAFFPALLLLAADYLRNGSDSLVIYDPEEF